MSIIRLKEDGGESSEDLMKAEGNVVGWDRARFCKGTITIFLPILSLCPFVADILNPRSFPMEALADFSFQSPSCNSHGIWLI